ncbi:hypothetical protein MtrunA17_Chr3g0109341 [Medicago truncatula]|uniref:Transmembrane protein, putative n=1 Tax=Medicago truncatula TaxID=3880 RepID=G7J778_MEDTR|nr:uncharacterized protein LOC11406720 [Medicago truncatula]AES70835.1 transmembrane protein, putative [Medicago truncatula]AFK35070.1 unknown [Medicago truncatula]RHN68033.1 hypothetical protein MtrunA17_Chr3g0109341 [Medicago truncatula]
MGFSRKHVTSIISLSLLVLLSLTCNLNSVSASSGGVAGGSFFKSSSSSSSKSFTTYSNSPSVRVQHHTRSHHARPKSTNGEGGSAFLLMVGIMVVIYVVCRCTENNDTPVTVLKLQVGMLDEMGCTLQRDLARIAEAANTSSKEGVRCLLKETIQTLDKHHGYCIAGYSSVDLKRSEEGGETCYNQLSIEEREKFDGETLVNLSNNNKTRIRSQSYDRFSNEYSTFDVKKNAEETEKLEKEKLRSGFDNKYIVVTILVATRGSHELPNMKAAEDLKEALQKLKSHLYWRDLLAGEVLWTPQKEDETLSDGKLLKDYPQLAKSMKYE